MDTTEKIKEIIIAQTGVREDSVDENTTIEDIVNDSLDVVEMLMNIEDAFDIDISDEDAEKLTTFGEVCRYIETRLNS